MGEFKEIQQVVRNVHIKLKYLQNHKYAPILYGSPLNTSKVINFKIIPKFCAV